MIREVEFTTLDPQVSLFDVTGLKGRRANEHGVDDYAEGPDIHLIRVPSATLKDLRGNIIWCATNSSLFLALVLETGGKPEIADLNLHFFGEKQVAELEVPVDDVVLVEVLKPFDDLARIAFDLELIEPLAAS